MTDHPVFSTQKRSKDDFRTRSSGSGVAAAGSKKSAGDFNLKDVKRQDFNLQEAMLTDKSHPLDSSFHADRGCLSTHVPRHGAAEHRSM